MKNETKIIAEKGIQELFIVREFEAPRDLVFRAFNEPDLLVQWLGPCDMTMHIDYLDSRSGGSYRFVHRNAAGQEFGFNGVIHDVTAPERMIRTFEFEGLPEKGQVVLETTKFEELANGRTRVTVQSVFQSVMDRDGMIQSGMEKGVLDSHERLDELIENGKIN